MLAKLKQKQAERIEELIVLLRKARSDGNEWEEKIVRDDLIEASSLARLMHRAGE